MKVIDQEPASWFLLQQGAALFLDVNCSHSFVSYSFLIALNDAEHALYQRRGREYLHELAHAIHYSAPGVAASHSPYKERNADRQWGAAVMEAIAVRRSGESA